MVIDEIKKRRSFRVYKTDMIADNLIVEVIKAAQFAPTAHGTMAIEFIIVTDPKTKADIFHIVGQEYVTEAPVLIVPVATEQSALPVQDLSVASQNIFLQATALGLASVWKNLSPEWEGQVKDLLGIPHAFRAINVIPLGMPNEEKPEHTDDEFMAEKIHREKW